MKSQVFGPGSIIGVLGGGQLGRMLALAARKMGYKIITLDPTPNSPTGQIADEQIVAAFDDISAALQMAEKCDVITYEFENIAVPSKIKIGTADASQVHELILNNRGFEERAEIEKQLEGVEYTPLKDFAFSQGFNISEKFEKDKISQIMKECEIADLNIEYTYNVGASDGSIIYNSLAPELQDSFYPIVMGPGSRSQRNIDPPRLTHGRNETFDKESGKRAIGFISDVVQKLTVLLPK